MTFCVLHADTKELMIHTGRDTQMLYLQPSSINVLFGKIPFQQTAHSADYLLDDY